MPPVILLALPLAFPSPEVTFKELGQRAAQAIKATHASRRDAPGGHKSATSPVAGILAAAGGEEAHRAALEACHGAATIGEIAMCIHQTAASHPTSAKEVADALGSDSFLSGFLGELPKNTTHATLPESSASLAANASAIEARAPHCAPCNPHSQPMNHLPIPQALCL